MIYFDHAATTPVYPEVFEEMKPFLKDCYANPSSSYEFGQDAKEMMDRARGQIAKTIGAKADEIYFTAGGTEADNQALIGTAEMLQKKGRHIITSMIEHPGVLKTCEYLEKRGFQITYLPVDEEGIVSPEKLEEAIREDTILISVMYANNEIGTLQPIGRIGEIAKKHQILFHTDAVQAYMHEKIDVNEKKLDLLSASGHKFGAPKGVGFLYVKDGIMLPAFVHGGEQEKQRRAGTENVAGIVGMGKASSIGEKNFEKNHKKILKLREYLKEKLLEEFPDCRINGSMEARLDNNINVSFRNLEAASLLLLLDMDGVCVSGGSACHAKNPNPSHVLQAIHVPEEYIRGTIRITLGAENTIGEINYFIRCLKEIILGFL